MERRPSAPPSYTRLSNYPSFQPYLAEKQEVRGEALGMAANGEAMGPDEIPAEVLKVGIRDDQIILTVFDAIIVKVCTNEADPPRWKNAVIVAIHEKKDRTTVVITGVSSSWRVLEIAAEGCSQSLERVRGSSEPVTRETVRLQAQPIDGRRGVCGAQVAENRPSQPSTAVCDLAKAYDSVDRKLLCKVSARLYPTRS